MLNERLLILTHFEEPVLFFDAFNIPKLPGLHFCFSNKTLFCDGIPSLIFTLINIPIIIDLLQNRLNDFNMPILRCADEVIIFDLKLFPQLQKSQSELIAVLLRRNIAAFCSLLDLLPVLIQAGQEKNLTTRIAMKAGKHISQYRGISMPDMRFIIYVINGGCDVEFIAHSSYRN